MKLNREREKNVVGIFFLPSSSTLKCQNAEQEKKTTTLGLFPGKIHITWTCSLLTSNNSNIQVCSWHTNICHTLCLHHINCTQNREVKLSILDILHPESTTTGEKKTHKVVSWQDNTHCVSSYIVSQYMPTVSAICLVYVPGQLTKCYHKKFRRSRDSRSINNYAMFSTLPMTWILTCLKKSKLNTSHNTESANK